MKRPPFRAGFATGAALFLAGCLDGPKPTPLDPAFVSRLGHAPELVAESDGTLRVSRPRAGAVADVNGTPAELRSDFAIWGYREKATLIGDVPLREEETQSFLRAATDSGLTVTSLHNRYLFEKPRWFSAHVEAQGNQERLAGALAAALGALETPPPRPPSPVRVNTKDSRLDPETMRRLLWKGEASAGTYRVELARGTRLAGKRLGSTRGARSWAAFAGSDRLAVVEGEVATLEFELPFVIRDLLQADVMIVSIHEHLTLERPRLVFVHFRGTGPVERLARGVKDAIWEKEKFQSQ